MAVGVSNNVTPAGSQTLTMLMIPTQLISNFAGNGAGTAEGNNVPATAASLQLPTGIAFDGTGNAFIADFSNNLVRMVDTNGIITTVAGGGTVVNSDGSLATQALLNGPSAVAVDGAGNLYICEQFANRVRKVVLTPGQTKTGQISTVTLSGNYTPSAPSGVAVDGGGNLYIADPGSHRVIKVNASLTPTVYAGGGTRAMNTADGGQANLAQLNSPYGVAADKSGNVYIADLSDKVVRVVSADGVINTLAGQFGVQGHSGDGSTASSATLFNPQGVAVDDMGNIFIADTGNNCVREILADGSNTIVTLAGASGLAARTGDNLPSFNAQLNQPTGVAVSSDGAIILVADKNNSRIRRIAPPGPPAFLSPPIGTPNPTVANTTKVDFTVAATGTPPPTLKWDFGDLTFDNSNTSAPPPHIYTKHGNYTVTVTATSPPAAPVTATMTEVVLPYTKVPSEIWMALPFNPDDPSASPLGANEANITPPITQVQVSGLKLNYKQTGKDAISIKMTVPLTGGLISPDKQQLVLDFGGKDANHATVGVVRVFNLAVKGKNISATPRDKNKNDAMKITLKNNTFFITATLKNENLMGTLTKIFGFALADNTSAIRNPYMDFYLLYGGNLYMEPEEDGLGMPVTYKVNFNANTGSGKTP